MLVINKRIAIPEGEVELHYIHAQGAGGQHVNKVATTAHLRFDFMASPSLAAEDKQRLQAMSDRRISKDGVIVIKAGRFRSQEKNRADALMRLADLIRAATTIQKKRRPTAPTKSSQVKRLEHKSKAARTKSLRRPVRNND